MAGLRERRHRETRQAVVEAAFDLFTERGYAQVTMEEIATAAGISRSTAYRRFATKEDVVLEVPRQWLGAFDEEVDSLPADTSLSEAARRACLAVAAHIDRNRAIVLAAYAILDEAPTLRASGVATSAWLDRMTRLVERFGQTDAETAAVIAGAYLGATEAMMQHWAATGGVSSVTETTERLVDRLEPILST